jgi:hypothetical protein
VIGLFLMSAALAAGTPQVTPPTRDGLIAEATDLLLNGEPLPSDLDSRLMQLSPADRIEVLVFLRRSGLLTGPGWTIDRLLAPQNDGGTK